MKESENTLRTEKKRRKVFEYLPQDDINRYPGTKPGRGWAVTGLVLVTVHLFLLGLVPPFACIGLIFTVIALVKGNHQVTVFLALLLGIAGILLSLWITRKLGGFVEDPATFLALFAEEEEADPNASQAEVSFFTNLTSLVSSWLDSFQS